jgi:hypothetical protein
MPIKFDPKLHDLVGLVEVEVVGDFTLRLVFDDGYERTVDLEPVLWGQIFEPLRDPKLFALVTIDPVTRVLTWPNGADMDNEVLRYDLETADGGPPARGAPARPVRSGARGGD